MPFEPFQLHKMHSWNRFIVLIVILT